MEFAIIIWLAFGLASMMVANSRGGNGCLWMFLGVLLGPLGLVFAFTSGEARVQCQYCRSSISVKAVKCPKCQSTLRERPAVQDQEVADTNAFIDSLPIATQSPLVDTEPTKRDWVPIIAVVGFGVLVLAGSFYWQSRHWEASSVGSADIPKTNLPDLPTPGTSSSDDYQMLISAVGEPASELSTEYDHPRPLMVTRISRYPDVGIKVVFVPIGVVGQGPPYPGWNVFAYFDQKTNKALSVSEASSRFAGHKISTLQPLRD